MREMKELKLWLLCAEALELALLTLCLTLPIALVIPAEVPTQRLWWALGTVIPVELIALICLRVEGLLPRSLLSLGVVAAGLIPALGDFRWLFYVPACLGILLVGLALGRPDGKLLLTVPKFYHPLASVLVYAIGRVGKNPLLWTLGIVLGGLLTLNYFFYLGKARLLRTIREEKSAELSPRGMIRLNRWTTPVYLLLGILLVAAVPLLLQRESRTERPTWIVEEVVTEPAAVTIPTAPPKKELTPTGEARPLDLGGLETAVMVLVIAFVACGLAAILLTILLDLRSVNDQKARHREPPKEDGWTLERLEPEEKRKHEEKLTGYEKRLRRRYARLILRRTAQGADLNPRTPTELERLAGLEGEDAEALHALYARTRYTDYTPTREDYRRFKDLAHRLEQRPAPQEPPRTP